MADAIHIHEDDWGMRKLHPVSGMAEAAADVDAAALAGEQNRAPDGAGWTDMHVIRPASKDYAAVGLKLASAAAVLEPLLPRVARFTSTASAGFDEGFHDESGVYEQQAWCYGFDEECFVKLEPAGELVKEIWYECRTVDEAHRGALRAALSAINAQVPSAIADYYLDMAGAVSDQAFLGRYFQEIAEHSD